jgi:hypothetical protein
MKTFSQRNVGDVIVPSTLQLASMLIHCCWGLGWCKHLLMRDTR